MLVVLRCVIVLCADDGVKITRLFSLSLSHTRACVRCKSKIGRLGSKFPPEIQLFYFAEDVRVFHVFS